MAPRRPKEKLCTPEKISRPRARKHSTTIPFVQIGSKSFRILLHFASAARVGQQSTGPFRQKIKWNATALGPSIQRHLVVLSQAVFLTRTSQMRLKPATVVCIVAFDMIRNWVSIGEDNICLRPGSAGQVEHVLLRFERFGDGIGSTNAALD